MATRLSTPPDACVLSCIPLEEADWIGSDRDFVRSNALQHTNGDSTGMWRLFQHEAGFVRTKLDAMLAAGVEVIVKAKASDIRSAALRHHNVVVIAHWTGDRVETWDSQLGPTEFAELFPPDFGGVAMTIVCYSDLLAEKFSVLRPQGMCICSSKTVNAGLGLAKLDAAFKLMRLHDVPLWRALAQASDIIDSLAT